MTKTLKTRRVQPQGMNVSLFDILAGYVIVFGVEMDKNLPFAEGGKQIIAKCERDGRDWHALMTDVCEAREKLVRRGTQYPDVMDVAQMAAEAHIG